jgi:hypothetical protein
VVRALAIQLQQLPFDRFVDLVTEQCALLSLELQSRPEL